MRALGASKTIRLALRNVAVLWVRSQPERICGSCLDRLAYCCDRCCQADLKRRRAVRCSIAIVALAILMADARAQDRDVDVKATINRGLSFLAKDSVAWKQSRKCYECHHAPFTIWALNEGKKHGYVVDEN